MLINGEVPTGGGVGVVVFFGGVCDKRELRPTGRGGRAGLSGLDLTLNIKRIHYSMY